MRTHQRKQSQLRFRNNYVNELSTNLKKLCTNDGSIEKNISKLKRKNAIFKERRKHKLFN